MIIAQISKRCKGILDEIHESIYAISWRFMPFYEDLVVLRCLMNLVAIS